MNKKVIITLVSVFFLAWMFVGVYEDDEFSEYYPFIKHRPTFKVFFYSPSGMSDRTIDEMSEEDAKEQVYYDEFILNH